MALEVAERVGATIVSVDSMQVYRGMDIGTAKPTTEEQLRVPHEMIDIAEPDTEFTVAEFRQTARAALERKTSPVMLIVGGSGLHFRSVVDPMSFRPTDAALRAELETLPVETLVAELLAADPAAGHHIDLSNRRRALRGVEALRLTGTTPSEWASTDDQRRYRAYEPELEFVGFALDNQDPAPAISSRLAQMRDAGFLAEVERLAPRLGRTASQAVGYRQLLEVVRGRAGVEEAFVAAEHATMALVKRQRTFFRPDPRLHWLDADQPDLADTIMKEAGL